MSKVYYNIRSALGGGCSPLKSLADTGRALLSYRHFVSENHCKIFQAKETQDFLVRAALNKSEPVNTLLSSGIEFDKVAQYVADTHTGGHSPALPTRMCVLGGSGGSGLCFA